MKDIFKSSETWFLLFCLGGSAGIVWLGYAHILPLSPEYWVFYSVIGFLFALWRPNLAFLCLLAFLSIEIVSLTPPAWGFMLRPYQWAALLIGFALGVRLLSGKLSWPLLAVNRIDLSLGLFVGSVGLSGFINGGLALKQSLVVVSFGYLYLLARIFFKTSGDLARGMVFIAVPATLSLIWGLLQNWLFLQGSPSWAVMPGRPNGTLAEPEWLGLLIVFLLGMNCVWLARNLYTNKLTAFILPSLWMTFLFLMLILTVSRSAWLGATALLGIFSYTAFKPPQKPFEWRPAFLFLRLAIFAFGMALLLTTSIPLTRFTLLDRASSVASHTQTITLACESPRADVPEYVERVEDLSADFRCEHINLEEREMRQVRGEWITTIQRTDPNVSIRQRIYATSFQILKEHPWFGIGWGNIGPRLGTDERGASYNASNLFLEAWLGGGLLAVAALALSVFWILKLWYQRWYRGDAPMYAAAGLLAIGAGFLVFNMFNMGLLLGFVWVGLAFFGALPQPSREPSQTQTL